MKFLQKYWLILVLAIIATVLLFFWIQGRNSSAPADEVLDATLPKIPYPEIGGQEIPAGASVSINAFPNASEAVVYQVTPIAFNHQQALSAAQSLGFPEQPSSINNDVVFGSYYLWMTESQTLTIRLSPVDVAISSDVLNLNTGQEFPDDSAAVNFINDIVGKIGVNTTGLRFIQTVSRTVFNDQVKEVGLVPVVEGVPVVDINPTAPMVLGRFKEDGSLFGFSYRSGFSSPQSALRYKIKTEGEMKSSLFNEGKIMVLGDPQEAPRVLTPSVVNIEKIINSLLFYPQKPTILFPIFVLEGKAQTGDGEVPIVIYMPSVKSDYLEGR